MYNGNPKFNGEGYSDPTAYDGTKAVIAEEDELALRVRTACKIIKCVAELAGLEVTNRIEIRDKKTGRVFR